MRRKVLYQRCRMEYLGQPKVVQHAAIGPIVTAISMLVQSAQIQDA
jgi:hypothetical protein